MNREKYVIGMDGGGTATAVYIETVGGQFLGRLRLGAINYNGQEIASVDRVFDDLLKGLADNGLLVEDCAGICIGSAGISNTNAISFMKSALSARGFEAKIKIVGDHETALAGAISGRNGVVLIAGTGSICYGINEQGENFRVGGYGHIIDDIGSAYAIGRDMLQAVIFANDGRGIDTCLTQLIFCKLKIEYFHQLMEWIYQKDRSKGDVAGLAVLLDSAMNQEDEVALRIFQNVISDLFLMVETMVTKMGEVKEIVFSGSVLLKNEQVQIELQKKITKEYPFIKVFLMRGEASYGAIKLWRMENE